MKIVKKTPDPHTTGDTKASMVLSEIAKQYMESGDKKGQNYIRKCFRYINDFNICVKQFRKIDDKLFRRQVYLSYFNQRFKPLLKPIEDAGYSRLSILVQSIMKASYRKYILEKPRQIL